MTDNPADVPYCVEGCGRPATTSRPLGVTAGGVLTEELLCDRCVALEMLGLLAERRS